MGVVQDCLMENDEEHCKGSSQTTSQINPTLGNSLVEIRLHNVG